MSKKEKPKCKYPTSGMYGGGSCGSPHVPDCPLSKDYDLTKKKKQKIIWTGDKWYPVDEDKWEKEFYKIQKDLEKQAVKDLYSNE